MGVLGPAAGIFCPLPTPAVANKLPVEGARSVSINTRPPGGSPGGGYPGGNTPPTGVLAVVSVGEAMAALLMVGSVHNAKPWLGVW